LSVTCADGAYGQDCKQNCYNNTCNIVSGIWLYKRLDGPILSAT
jgi:hypothetical protein